MTDHDLDSQSLHAYPISLVSLPSVPCPQVTTYLNSPSHNSNTHQFPLSFNHHPSPANLATNLTELIPNTTTIPITLAHSSCSPNNPPVIHNAALLDLQAKSTHLRYPNTFVDPKELRKSNTELFSDCEGQLELQENTQINMLDEYEADIIARHAEKAGIGEELDALTRDDPGNFIGETCNQGDINVSVSNRRKENEKNRQNHAHVIDIAHLNPDINDLSSNSSSKSNNQYHFGDNDQYDTFMPISYHLRNSSSSESSDFDEYDADHIFTGNIPCEPFSHSELHFYRNLRLTNSFKTQLLQDSSCGNANIYTTNTPIQQTLMNNLKSILSSSHLDQIYTKVTTIESGTRGIITQSITSPQFHPIRTRLLEKMNVEPSFKPSVDNVLIKPPRIVGHHKEFNYSALDFFGFNLICASESDLDEEVGKDLTSFDGQRKTQVHFSSEISSSDSDNQNYQEYKQGSRKQNKRLYKNQKRVEQTKKCLKNLKNKIINKKSRKKSGINDDICPNIVLYDNHMALSNAEEVIDTTIIITHSPFSSDHDETNTKEAYNPNFSTSSSDKNLLLPDSARVTAKLSYLAVRVQERPSVRESFPVIMRPPVDKLRIFENNVDFYALDDVTTDSEEDEEAYTERCEEVPFYIELLEQSSSTPATLKTLPRDITFLGRKDRPGFNTQRVNIFHHKIFKNIDRLSSSENRCFHSILTATLAPFTQIPISIWGSPLPPRTLLRRLHRLSSWDFLSNDVPQNQHDLVKINIMMEQYIKPVTSQLFIDGIAPNIVFKKESKKLTCLVCYQSCGYGLEEYLTHIAVHQRFYAILMQIKQQMLFLFNLIYPYEQYYMNSNIQTDMDDHATVLSIKRHQDHIMTLGRYNTLFKSPNYYTFSYSPLYFHPKLSRTAPSINDLLQRTNTRNTTINTDYYQLKKKSRRILSYRKYITSIIPSSPLPSLINKDSIVTEATYYASELEELSPEARREFFRQKTKEKCFIRGLQFGAETYRDTTNGYYSWNLLQTVTRLPYIPPKLIQTREVDNKRNLLTPNILTPMSFIPHLPHLAPFGDYETFLEAVRYNIKILQKESCMRCGVTPGMRLQILAHHALLVHGESLNELYAINDMILHTLHGINTESQEFSCFNTNVAVNSEIQECFDDLCGKTVRNTLINKEMIMLIANIPPLRYSPENNILNHSPSQFFPMVHFPNNEHLSFPELIQSIRNNNIASQTQLYQEFPALFDKYVATRRRILFKPANAPMFTIMSLHCGNDLHYNPQLLTQAFAYGIHQGFVESQSESDPETDEEGCPWKEWSSSLTFMNCWPLPPSLHQAPLFTRRELPLLTLDPMNDTHNMVSLAKRAKHEEWGAEGQKLVQLEGSMSKSRKVNKKKAMVRKKTGKVWSKAPADAPADTLAPRKRGRPRKILNTQAPEDIRISTRDAQSTTNLSPILSSLPRLFQPLHLLSSQTRTTETLSLVPPVSLVATLSPPITSIPAAKSTSATTTTSLKNTDNTNPSRPITAMVSTVQDPFNLSSQSLYPSTTSKYISGLPDPPFQSKHGQ